MTMQLVLPGLIWPIADATALTTGLSLPALERLCGCARITHHERASSDDAVCAAFGLAASNAPIAALRRLGESSKKLTTASTTASTTEPATRPAGSVWLCADPVHLHFARERMLLSDAYSLDITAAEADALTTALNAFFASEEPGLAHFEATTPNRWYLPLDSAVDARFFALNDVIGRPISHCVPAGDDARRWQQIANEIQVLLHNHPVNQAREADGRPTINSIWFWGPGAVPENLVAPAPRILANDPLSRGLARACGIAPDGADAPVEGDTFVVLDALHPAALHLDLHAWRTALLDLETRWFTPLLAMLKSRRITSLVIRCPGDHASLTLELVPSDLWKFWRRPRTHESLTRPAP